MKNTNQEKNYISNTVEAYQNTHKAESYYKQHHNTLSWARFIMWLELRSVKNAFKFFGVDGGNILDVPCGTGIAGQAISNFNCKITAIDISQEMQQFAKNAYESNKLSEFIIGDITNLPLQNNFAMGSVVLGFLHRVPNEIINKTFLELHRVNSDFVIFSFSIDSSLQRLKKFIYSKINKDFVSAPSPKSLKEMEKLLLSSQFKIEKIIRVFPFLSSEVIIWLRKI